MERQQTSPEDLLLLADVAAGFSTMAEGRQRAALLAASRDFSTRAFDAKFGRIDPQIAALTDDELLASLYGEF